MELRDVVNGSSPVRIPPDATAADALVALVENKTDFIMVDRAADGDAYGIISRRDIVLRPIAEGKPLSNMAALECAHKPVMVMHNLDLDVRWVAKKMANEKVSVIMVFEGEKFLGSVSDVDILKAVAAESARKGETGEA